MATAALALSSSCAAVKRVPSQLHSALLPGPPPSTLAPTTTGLRRHSKRDNTRLAVFAAVTTAPPGANFAASIASFFKRLLPKGPGGEESQEEEEEMGEEEVRRKVAVLGATGRTGKFVVARLLENGHAVTALVSSLDRAREVLEEGLGLQLEGKAAKGLKLVEGRVQDPDALRALLQGNDSVICCLGSFGGPNNSNSNSAEEIDWKGVSEAVNAAVAELEGATETAPVEGDNLLEAATKVVLDFTASREGEALLTPAAAVAEVAAVDSGNGGVFDEGERLPGWKRRDDVIMGGQSESIIKAENGYAVFEGVVRVEGGGFCGANTVFPSPVDGSQYDGFRLRVRGDGKRYKINTRGASQVDGPVQYQASFDTVRGQWADVFIPFSSFQAVNKGTLVAAADPLEISALAGVVLLQSRFQYNGFPNPLAPGGGPFRLEVESIALERKPRTQFVLLSSAAVERSSRAQTPEEREASIPIVKLNPAGVLSWKLSGEDVLRASGLRYTVVRPCGLTDKDEDQPFLLESAQGDAITGLISRQETAAVCVEALDSPYAADVTFEIRRDELSKGFAMLPRHWSSLFMRLRPDTSAAVVQYPAVPKSLMDANKE